MGDPSDDSVKVLEKFDLGLSSLPECLSHAKSVWGSARERIRSSQIDRLLGQEPTDSRKQLHSTELCNAVHLKVEAVFLNLSLNLARSAVCYLGGFG